MNVLINDGVMEAKEVYGGWVLIRWLGDQSRSTFTKLYRDFKNVESLIRLNGFRGWLVASEPFHTQMHDLLKRVGADQYGKDDEALFFRKELNHEIT